MRRLLPLIICSVLFTAPALAQEKGSARLTVGDLPAQPVAVFPYRTFQKDLPNGLRIIVVPTDFPNLVALQVIMQVGSRNEVEPGKTGFAHFFEHLMFRGTPRFPVEKGRHLLKGLGINDNAWTWDDLTVFHKVFSKIDLATVLDFDADRFQHLKFTPEDFRTESKAVLGEYNKNSSDPEEKMLEVLQDAAFSVHTYKHTTMGFLKDIEDMPNQFDYSQQFFSRWYRPGNATVLLVGDLDPDRAIALAERYFSAWKPATEAPPALPKEPAPQGPKTAHVEWPSPTQPWVTVAYHIPAYTDSGPDTAALRLMASLAFSENSTLNRRLVLNEQKVDRLDANLGDHRDPFLFMVSARVKQESDLQTVTADLIAEFEKLGRETVSTRLLHDVKSHLIYDFSLHLDNSEAIANALAVPLGLRRTPYTVNRLFQQIEKVTPEQIREIAARTFTPSARVVVTLSHSVAQQAQKSAER